MDDHLFLIFAQVAKIGCKSEIGVDFRPHVGNVGRRNADLGFRLLATGCEQNGKQNKARWAQYAL